MKPGVSRGITMGFVGFVVGALTVLILRGLQSMDPLWDPEIALILCAFTITGFFLWGVGAFDPRMSVHGEHAADEHHGEEEAKPGSVLLGLTWRMTALTVVILVVLFAMAMLPTGLSVIKAGEAGSSVFENGFAVFELPFGAGPLTIGGQPVVVSQFTILIVFIIIMVISLVAVAGALGLILYWLNRSVTEVRAAEVTNEMLTPPLPIRLLGRFAGWLAQVLRGLPAFLGQK